MSAQSSAEAPTAASLLPCDPVPLPKPICAPPGVWLGAALAFVLTGCALLPAGSPASFFARSQAPTQPVPRTQQPTIRAVPFSSATRAAAAAHATPTAARAPPNIPDSSTATATGPPPGPHPTRSPDVAMQATISGLLGLLLGAGAVHALTLWRRRTRRSAVDREPLVACASNATPGVWSAQDVVRAVVRRFAPGAAALVLSASPMAAEAGAMFGPQGPPEGTYVSSMSMSFSPKAYSGRWYEIASQKEGFAGEGQQDCHCTQVLAGWPGQDVRVRAVSFSDPRVTGSSCRRVVCSPSVASG